MTREMTDCRIFGALTGAVYGGGDTRKRNYSWQTWWRKLLDRSNRRAYTL